MKLLIAIPAYNEEASIESIIHRSLAARDQIVTHSPVTDVEVTVVSDGSTDHTVEIARHFQNTINLIEFTSNQGYGAAIQEAWKNSDAELLGFLDADGTCDPNFFSDLCSKIEEEKADVVLGCRMSKGSKMPLVRRLGNWLFAGLLRLVSSARVRDTASGMRVVRRSSLKKLLPLPTGLHFTPAMSARALLGAGIKISEIEMPYEERQGESKLKVGKDGLRFLHVILETAFLHRPSRPLGLLGLGCLVVASVLMIVPGIYYLQHRQVAEWMIYRFVVSHLAGTSAALLFSASYLSGRMVEIVLTAEANRSAVRAGVGRFLASRWFWLAPLAMFLVGGLLVLPSFIERVRTGATYEHWSRFIAMTLLYAVALILIVTRAMDYILDLVAARLEYKKKTQSF